MYSTSDASFNTAILHLSQGHPWNLLDLIQFILAVISVLAAFRTVMKWHKQSYSLSS